MSEIEESVTRLRRDWRRVSTERVVSAFVDVGRLWEQRLAMDWTPPEGSPFPWAQVRLSLAALLPGMATAGEWRERVVRQTSSTGKAAALILAGNTPLMSWSPLAACLLAGYGVFVKMSRHETLWPRLFVEALTEVAPDVAAMIHLDVWPGEDKRTAELVGCVDAVIAFGGDSTLESLKAISPNGTPFFGFGHASSVGIVPKGANGASLHFAHDILMYGQAGCLSPQAIFIEGDASRSLAVAAALRTALSGVANKLGAEPIIDAATATAVRNARDLALLDGHVVFGDDALRWSVIAASEPTRITQPVGHGVILIAPLENVVRDLPFALGPLRGRLSCIGYTGHLTPEQEGVIRAEGVSRICPAGEMQMPPLDWPNGGFDLLEELLCL